MIEFIQMRAMTIQAKIAGNGYEEVDYFPQQDELAATAIAKTPRPGTSFQRAVKTALNVRFYCLLGYMSRSLQRFLRFLMSYDERCAAKGS